MTLACDVPHARGAPLSADVTEADHAWRRIRALWTCHQRGWIEYVAAEPKARPISGPRTGGSRWLVRQPKDAPRPGALRELRREEVIAWAFGVACAHGEPEALDGLDGLEAPELITEAQAAALLHLSPDGVRYRLRGGHVGRLYPFYHAAHRGIVRKLIAAQVRTIADPNDAAAAAAWEEIRKQLPPPTRFADLPDYRGPAPSPTPLPVDGPTRYPAEETRAIQALMIGDAEGWFRHNHSDAAASRYSVTVHTPTGEIDLTLPGPDVLAWVLGHADTHGHGDLVAYREGLG